MQSSQLLRLRPLTLPFMLGLASLGISAQATHHRSALADDSAWTRLYATDCGPAMKHPCSSSTDGYENEFLSDARFPALLKRSLPQSESWWVDGYGGSSPVSAIVPQFIGIPGPLVVDQDRYVTATGCVPHDCMTHGLLWIDTGTKPATVIFVGEDLVAGGEKGDSGYHLYLYTSRELATYYAGNRPIGIFAPEFLKQVARWRDANVSRYDSQKVLLVTVVWPNGRTRDLFWSDLLQPPSTSIPGAKQ